jgi:NAD-dependent SIR2 family protein deacetylase
MSIDFVSKSIIEDGVSPICPKCGGIGKPDIVFFGEDLPNVFHNNINRDCRQADLLIVIGTSLAVQPVASIPEFVSDSIPRLLLNREHVGGFDTSEYNYRDVFVSGNCDNSVEKLCEMLGWGDELKNAYDSVEGRGGEGKKPAASTEEVD